jgi:hypothetical protein
VHLLVKRNFDVIEMNGTMIKKIKSYRLHVLFTYLSEIYTFLSFVLIHLYVLFLLHCCHSCTPFHGFLHYGAHYFGFISPREYYITSAAVWKFQIIQITFLCLLCESNLLQTKNTMCNVRQYQSIFFV